MIVAPGSTTTVEPSATSVVGPVKYVSTSHCLILKVEVRRDYITGICWYKKRYVYCRHIVHIIQFRELKLVSLLNLHREA